MYVGDAGKSNKMRIQKKKSACYLANKHSLQGQHNKLLHIHVMTLNNVPYLRVSFVTAVPELMVRVMLILNGYLRPYVSVCTLTLAFIHTFTNLYIHS